MKKIFVLDTSVIVFDHNSINNFHEHNVVLPITVLEELDKFKNETGLAAPRNRDVYYFNQSLVQDMFIMSSHKNALCLLEMKNNVNHRDSLGSTALMIGPTSEVVDRLLELGADPFVKDRRGQNVLHRLYNLHYYDNR